MEISLLPPIDREILFVISCTAVGLAAWAMMLALLCRSAILAIFNGIAVVAATAQATHLARMLWF